MQQQEASLMFMGQCAVQLFSRLSEKRIAVEKEFSKIPAPPKASKDVFQLCRGFERAFAQTLEVSVDPSISTASRICLQHVSCLSCVRNCQYTKHISLSVCCCWGLQQVWTHVQTVGYSAMIREAFQGDKGLQGIVKKLPIERQFRLDNVKTVSA